MHIKKASEYTRVIAFQIPANYPSPGELVVFDEAAAKWQRQPVARLRASYDSDSEPPIAHPPFESYVVVEQSLASDHEGVSGPSIDEDKFVNRFDTVARRHIERSKCILALIDMLVDEHITPGPKKILKKIHNKAPKIISTRRRIYVLFVNFCLSFYLSSM